MRSKLARTAWLVRMAMIALILSANLLGVFSLPALAGDATPEESRLSSASNGLNSMPRDYDPAKMISADEQRLIANKNLERDKFVKERTEGKQLYYGSMNKVLNVPAYQQQTSYWCGPASMAMLLGYEGRYYSQSYIASLAGTNSSEGTYVYRVRQTLNQLGRKPTSWWVWEERTVNDFNRFVNDTDFDLNYDEATVLNVQTNPPDGTPYKLAGYVGNYYHYITGHGRQGDTMTYSDPYQDTYRGSGSTLGRHTSSAYNLFWVTKAQGWMIY